MCDTTHPRQSELVLGAFPTAIPCARLHTRQLVWEWGLTDLCEAAELVISELVTNAVRASQTIPGSLGELPTIQLWLSANQKSVLIQVWDGCDQLPQRQDPGPYDDHGRGLAIVDAVSSNYGAFRLEDANGKIVWAIVGPG